MQYKRIETSLFFTNSTFYGITVLITTWDQNRQTNNFDTSKNISLELETNVFNCQYKLFLSNNQYAEPAPFVSLTE